jgi:hypothetical protein
MNYCLLVPCIDDINQSNDDLFAKVMMILTKVMMPIFLSYIHELFCIRSLFSIAKRSSLLACDFFLRQEKHRFFIVTHKHSLISLLDLH